MGVLLQQLKAGMALTRTIDIPGALLLLFIIAVVVVVF